jgi:arylsulfatase A-like enzyme
VGKLKTVLFFTCLLWQVFYSGCLASQQDRDIKTGDYAGYNVLFVSFDALQAAHTSCLGYFRKTTPTIDKFARQGFLFENAVSSSSWTVPATMSWFTSLYPSQHRCINKYSIYTQDEHILTNLKKLSPEVTTLAQVLKKNGYVTGGFTGDAGVSGLFGFNQGFDVYIDGPKFGGMDISIPNALEWLQEVRDKKFFLFLHGYDCHGQYDPPKGYTYKFLDFNYKGSLKGGKEEEAKFREEGLEKGYIRLTEEDVRFWRALYDEKINDVDRRFSQFVERLKDMGLLDKTIVILVSDHGTEFYEHNRFDHGFSLYDELIHVPLVFWLPDAKGGRVIDEQVRALDIMPTIFDLLGIRYGPKLEEQMKGVSLLPLMNGEHTELVAFSETDYRLYTHKRSIRTPQGWKFIYTMETGEKELYNLKEDPGELNNLLEKEPRIAYEMEQELFSWLKSMGQDEYYYKKIWANMLKIKEY